MDNVKVVDITSEMSVGSEEVYGEFFKCPECGVAWISRSFSYCPSCGMKLHYVLDEEPRATLEWWHEEEGEGE